MYDFKGIESTNVILFAITYAFFVLKPKFCYMNKAVIMLFFDSKKIKTFGI